MAKDADKRLRFYAERFPVVELDSSYYAIPDPAQAALWAERTPAGFTMNVKAFATITGHPAETARLPRDLRESLPAEIQAKRRLDPKDLPADVLTEIHARFWIALRPLREAGKLGAVLLQLPEWVGPGRAARDAIRRMREMLPDDRLAVEFRNAAWMAEGDRASTLAFLRENGLTYVSVDGPQGFRSSMPPVAAVTDPELAIVRFHGRNTESWKEPGLTAAQRFNYLYSREELGEWVPRVRDLAAEAKEVQLLMNNCHGDQAVRNAADFVDLLS